MQIIRKYTLSVLVLLLSVVHFSYGSDTETPEETKEGFNAGEMIMHHIGDSHAWHFATINDFHATIPLPVIIYNPEKGIEVFSSSNFVDETGHPNLLEGS